MLRYMTEEPTEYSPEYQDEYRRLWHEAAADRDRYRGALEIIRHHRQRIGIGPWHDLNDYIDEVLSAKS